MRRSDTRPTSLRDDWPLLLLITLTPLALSLNGLGDYGLFDPWETHYGEVAREMNETGNYIDPFWGSPWDTEGVKREREPFYSKPPLTLWMMAAGMKLFGPTALGVRALFPLLTALALGAIYFVTARLTTRRAGLLAAGLLALTPSFTITSLQAVTDSPLLALITLTAMSLTMAMWGTKDGERASGPLRLTITTLLTLTLIGQLWVIWPMDRSPDALIPFTERAPQGLSTPLGELLRACGAHLTDLWRIGRGKGWVIVTLITPLTLWVITRAWNTLSRRQAYFTLTYLFAGLTVIAKGWLGWAPIGGALTLYLISTGEWRWLRVARPAWGLLVVLITGHLWALAMLGGHHPGWYTRFVIHDHVNRLFSGVHSTDSGGLEYFVQWIGYGLFPTIALLPAALGKALGGLRRAKDQAPTPQRGYERLLIGWATFSFVMMSASSTKFHHYIFPALPPLIILCALWLDAHLTPPANQPPPKRPLHRIGGLLIAAATLTWVGGDLTRPSAAPSQGAQGWVNLFTYKYDRDWPTPPTQAELNTLSGAAIGQAWTTTLTLPLTLEAQASHSKPLQLALHNARWHADLSTPIQSALIIALIGLLLLAAPALPLQTLGALTLLASALLTHRFISQTYLPKIAPLWSQAELWEAYYSGCTPVLTPQMTPKERQRALEDHARQLHALSGRIPDDLESPSRRLCVEPAVAFRMNWRGETFHTGNTVTPALYGKDLKVFLTQRGIWETWQPNADFYIFTERKRIQSELEPHLPPYLRGKYTEVFGEGRHFVLLKVSDPQQPPTPTQR